MNHFTVVLATCLLICGRYVAMVSSLTLRDHPFEGDTVTYLDGEDWKVSSTDGSYEVDATVPGDLLTDLERAKLIDDPLFEMNFLNNSMWQDHQWQYTKTFSIDQATLDDKGTEIVLVLDGVKMGASIFVNGEYLGNVADQFLRYRFVLDVDTLKADSNVLLIKFDPSIDCETRWMACTGGWDWAPYTQTTQEGAGTFSYGIWKSVSIVTVRAAAISYVVPHVYYRGQYPIVPLRDGNHAGFDVVVRVHVYAPRAVEAATIAISPSWDAERNVVKQTVDVPPGDSTFDVMIGATASQINLWWPNGLGEQYLYNVTTTLHASSSVIQTTRRIGFRHFAIVTGNDTSVPYVENSVNKTGTSDMGMFFRVNGAAVFARGANMIPMEELEGRSDAAAFERLVTSASDVGFNVFRVWGGGVFLPTVFYDMCDEMGIMLYHDMMYAQRGHSPQASSMQSSELRHQIRRLGHHTSIVIWDGCNECVVTNNGTTSIYATFVLKTVAEEDRSRSMWAACPAAGWSSGVDRLTSRPNGTPLLTKYDIVMEKHGPYQHGTDKWISADKGGFDPSINTIPIIVSDEDTSVGLPGVFGSEFGTVVMSSFESMSPLLRQEHWGLHGGAPDERCTAPGPCDGKNAMAERNYNCDPLISRYFGEDAAMPSVLNRTGEGVFKKQLYQCMLAQALEMKSDIENRRSTNTLGIIVWQYNEIWPTGGWGSIEYGTPRQGQVLGGRWKPLHYFYANHLYRDVMCACNMTTCFVKNDGTRAFEDGALKISAVDVMTGQTRVVYEDSKLTLEAGPSVKRMFTIDTSSMDVRREILNIEIRDSAGHVESHHVNALTYPQNMTSLPKSTLSASAEMDKNGTMWITVTSDQPAALYVVLTTLAHGRFEDNAFLLLGGSRRLRFYPFLDDQFAILKSSVRVEDLSGNLGPAT